MLLSLIVLGVGIVGAVLTRVEAPQSVDVAVEKEPEEPTVLVWMPKDELVMGQRVERASLTLQQVPESQALTYGIKEDVDLKFVPNMVVNRLIEPGTPIYPEDIILPNQAGYFKLIMDPGTVPYPISVDLASVVGGVVEANSSVDVLALGAKSQNLSNGAQVRNIGELVLTPILFNVKVLQVTRTSLNMEGESSAPKAFGGQGRVPSAEGELASVVLQLSRKEVATLTVAKRIAQLEVHLSTGETSVAELSADAGDVMTDFKSVKEYRPGVGSAVGVE